MFKFIYLVIFLSSGLRRTDSAMTPRKVRAINPCSTVSCYYNSMCVLDRSTDEPICVCPKDECDEAYAFPVCADGNTYKSACHAQIQMCLAQKWMTIQHVGVCGPQECGRKTPCPFYGRCGNGVCSCERCKDVDNRRTLIDVEPHRHIAVCGSDGVTYPSECHLRYQSCKSRMLISVAKTEPCHRRKKKAPKPRNAPIRSMTNHLNEWMQTFDKPKPVKKYDLIPNKELASFEGPCPKYELRGCLPAKHHRAILLGVYTLLPGYSHLGSPVYRKRTYFGLTRRQVHLSRYNSSRFINGTWVIGSKIGSGAGWFGVNDASTEPEYISGLWHSTSGIPSKPWRPEPAVYGKCVGKEDDAVAETQECDLGDERSPLGMNWQSATQDTPLYELRITRPFKRKYYKPNEKIIVEVITNNRAMRFKYMFLSIQNEEVGECGLPELKRTRSKFVIQCGGRIISRNGKRMKKVVLHLRAPARGCLTFRAFVKSVTDEVFYDNNMKGSLTPMHLTKKICHSGYREPLLVPKKIIIPNAELLLN